MVRFWIAACEEVATKVWLLILEVNSMRHFLYKFQLSFSCFPLVNHSLFFTSIVLTKQHPLMLPCSSCAATRKSQTSLGLSKNHRYKTNHLYGRNKHCLVSPSSHQQEFCSDSLAHLMLSLHFSILLQTTCGLPPIIISVFSPEIPENFHFTLVSLQYIALPQLL